MVDADLAKVAVDLGQFALLSAVGLHQWLISRDRVRREQLSALETELERVITDHSARLTRMEARVETMPSGAHCGAQAARVATLEEAVRRMPDTPAIARIHARIDEIAVSGAEIRATVRKLEEMVARLDRYLDRLEN